MRDLAWRTYKAFSIGSKFQTTFNILQELGTWLKVYPLRGLCRLLINFNCKAPTGDRTQDHTLTKRMLYQLSYRGTFTRSRRTHLASHRRLLDCRCEQTGTDPASNGGFLFEVADKRNTCRTTAACNQENNSSGSNMMTLAGLEPAIFGSEDQRLIH
jgi:hypothetical protein